MVYLVGEVDLLNEIKFALFGYVGIKIEIKVGGKVGLFVRFTWFKVSEFNITLIKYILTTKLILSNHLVHNFTFFYHLSYFTLHKTIKNIMVLILIKIFKLLNNISNIR